MTPIGPVARAVWRGLMRPVLALQRFGAELGRLPSAVLIVAALAVTMMYCANDNLPRDKDGHVIEGRRGDGQYRPDLARGDGHMHFLVTRSLVFDGDTNWDNDLAAFGDPWNQPRTVTGRKNLMQQVGPSLIWAPVLATAHGLALVANVFGADIPTHGYTMFHQRILFATSVVFALLAIGLGIAVARRLLGGRWSAVHAGVAVLLGTSLTYYATYMPSYAHAMDAAATAGFFALWVRGIGQLAWRRFVWLGVVLGLSAMVRTSNLGFGIVVALELGLLALRRLRARDAALGPRARAAAEILSRGAVVLAVAVVMQAPQFYVWKQMYNEWITTPQGPGWFRWRDPMWLELLFSAKNGWFSTHPLAYLGVLGLFAGAIAGPRLGPNVRLVCIGFLVACATAVYVNAASYDWWGGAAFGQRRMCSATLPLVVGNAIVLRGLHRAIGPRLPVWSKHVIAIAVLGWFVVWNLNWVGQLWHGKGAGHEPGPICCKDIPRPMRWIAEPVYRAVGNPFSLPGSAVFALRHGVELQRWDTAVGYYPLQPPHLGYNDGSYRRASAEWWPGDAHLLAGWGPGPAAAAGKVTRRWRWTTAPTATVLVPLFLPEPQRITVPIAANAPAGQTVAVTVTCNGAAVAHAAVGASWTTITFDTDGEVGESEIGFSAEVAPYRVTDPGGPAAPGKQIAVGLAVGPLHLALPQRP
jgi:hypothetical protein